MHFKSPDESDIFSSEVSQMKNTDPGGKCFKTISSVSWSAWGCVIHTAEMEVSLLYDSPPSPKLLTFPGGKHLSSSPGIQATKKDILGNSCDPHGAPNLWFLWWCLVSPSPFHLLFPSETCMSSAYSMLGPIFCRAPAPDVSRSIRELEWMSSGCYSASENPEAGGHPIQLPEELESKQK